MAVLESEWRRRERAREAEAAAVKQEYSVLEDKAQQVSGQLADDDDDPMGHLQVEESKHA